MSVCQKVRYRDRIGALLALANVQRKDSAARPKSEKRVYRCPQCSGYHLTSKPMRQRVKKSKRD